MASSAKIGVCLLYFSLQPNANSRILAVHLKNPPKKSSSPNCHYETTPNTNTAGDGLVPTAVCGVSQ
jgi:hypothetical protein